MDELGFIAKVIVVSAVLAAVIRYGAPLFTWSPTLPLVLGMVLLPSLVMAIALWIRGKRVTNTGTSGQG